MAWRYDRLYALNCRLQTFLLSEPFEEFGRTVSLTVLKKIVFSYIF